jgi:hypothetical protein
MDSNTGQKAETAVGQTSCMSTSDNLREVPESSTSTSGGRWRKAVRKLNLEKKNQMPSSRPVTEPLEISMYAPRYQFIIHNRLVIFEW